MTGKISKKKRLEALIAQVEKEAYGQTFKTLTRHFPFCNVKIIEENKPLPSETGFYPENDTDFRISLRGGDLEEHGDEDGEKKLLSGEYTPTQVGEAVSTLYLGKVLNTMITYDLKQNEAGEGSRLNYSIETGRWEE